MGEDTGPDVCRRLVEEGQHYIACTLGAPIIGNEMKNYISFLGYTSTLFNFVRDEIRSCHSVRPSKDFRAFSMAEVNCLNFGSVLKSFSVFAKSDITFVEDRVTG